MSILKVNDMIRPKSLNRINGLPLDSNLVFSSGIWISSSFREIPIRYLSYLLPIISCTQKYSNSIGQIYTADQAAIRMGVDKDVVSENVKLIRELTSGFIAEMFPELKDRIVVCEEKNKCDDGVLKTREDLINQLVDILLQCGDGAILRFANNRSKWDIRSSLRYMAEHSLYMRDNVTDDSRLFLINSPLGFDDSQVVMIWWPAEEIFYKTRKVLMKALNRLDGQINVQLFTDIGKLPPYYRKCMESVVGKRVEDLDVRVFLEKLDSQLIYDYLMLIIACSENPNYYIVKKQKIDLNDQDYQLLQNGFERLIYFLKQF